MPLLHKCANAVGLLLLIMMLPGAAESAAPVRSADDCDFLARSNDRQYVANDRCATAATKAGVGQIVRRCSELGAIAPQIERQRLSERARGFAGAGNQATLYTLFRVFSIDRASAARQPVFHQLSSNRTLVEIPCRTGAYNQSSVFFAYDATRLPATFRPMAFPRPAGGETTEVWIRGFDPVRGLLVVFRKARGMGDAGEFAVYAIDRTTMHVRILRAISKSVWDGRDRFQWDGRFDDQPRGATWRRTI